MEKLLTVVMPYLNEKEQPRDILRSLFASVDPKLVNVVAIDDCSNSDMVPDLSEFPDIVHLRHVTRAGVDASRQEGVNFAETPFVLLLDAHMRFNNDGWFGRLIDHLQKNPKTVFCTATVGLGYGIDDMAKSKRLNKGAYFSFTNPDRRVLSDGHVIEEQQVCEGKWLPADQWPNESEFEISCIMGANYAMRKEWFLRLHGLAGLRMWGTSEPFLSLKSWLAGGDCKCAADVHIGHFFRDYSPFASDMSHLIYNKFLLMSILFPKELTDTLLQHFPKDGNVQAAYERICADNAFIREERKHFDSIKVRDIYWLARKFSLPLP